MVDQQIESQPRPRPCLKPSSLSWGGLSWGSAGIWIKIKLKMTNSTSQS